ncbi:MAG: hypothetical protein JRM86_02920 [Nitrososphaerota archaeon]|nr:hypothetical protein [Nitrososphaerota archaeon]MDG7005866.1 hypothetical protein [Nitrososphaerota archaeon]
MKLRRWKPTSSLAGGCHKRWRALLHMRAAALVLLALLLAGFVLPAYAAAGQSSPGRAPAALEVTVVPPVLPADSSAQQALVVSLLDSSGEPTLSLANVTVFLSSSNASVGSIPTTVTLPAGQAFVRAPVSTSSRAGSTTLAAASAGLQPASFVLKTTVTASKPVALALFLAPPKSVTALSGADEVFAVQAVDSAGNPAFMSSGTNVVLTASNGTILRDPINVAIGPASDLVYGTFEVQAAGSTTLTALAPRLATGSAQLSVLPASASLSVSANPPYISIDGVASLTVSVTVLGMPVPGVSVTLTAGQGTLVPGGTFATGQSGQAVARFIPAALGAATITASSDSTLLGALTADTTVVVTGLATTTSSPPAGPNVLSGLYGLIPVFVIVAVLVAGLVLVKRTLRKRQPALAGDDQAPEEPKP